jgi:O-acetyl-ADP-ribose deacetylase (regulator of RNase III)
MIQYRYDNMFESRADALVNPINCVGTMGAGLAKEFKRRFPGLNDHYVAAAARREVKVGRILTFPTLDQSGRGPRYIFNFPTKDQWRNPSQLSWIVSGLDNLREVCDDLAVRSIAIPALGCGLGGLDWDDVSEAIQRAFSPVSHTMTIYVYPPQ